MTGPEAEAGRRALQEFRRWRRGALLADGRPTQVKFVTDPATGAVIAPVERGVMTAEELVLFVPDEGDESLQLLLGALPNAVGEDLVDRWRIHHGDPPASVATPDPTGRESTPSLWGAFEIEGARLGGELIDGDALMAPNALRMVEPKMCKRLNADRRLLWRICKMKTGVDLPTDVGGGGPVCVGVDTGGLHVRGKMGVLRVEFDRVADGSAPEGGAPDEAAAEAERQIDALLRRGESA